jgi:hypothetical protein
MAAKRKGLIALLEFRHDAFTVFHAGDEVDPDQYSINAHALAHLIKIRRIGYGYIETPCRIVVQRMQNAIAKHKKGNDTSAPSVEKEASSPPIVIEEKDPLEVGSKKEPVSEEVKTTGKEGCSLFDRGGGWYDVMYKGAPVNERPMRKVDAENLITTYVPGA